MVGVDSRSWRPGRSDGRAGLARVVMFFAVTDRNKKKHQLLASRAGALLRRDPPRARDALALSKYRGLAPALLRDLGCTPAGAYGAFNALSNRCAHAVRVVADLQ